MLISEEREGKGVHFRYGVSHRRFFSRRRRWRRLQRWMRVKVPRVTESDSENVREQ